MNELSKVLNDIGGDIQSNKIVKGWKITKLEDWEDKHEIPAVLMLITTEIAEAMEAFRKNDKVNFAEELADVMIRTIGLAHGMGIDLGAEIEAKNGEEHPAAV